MEASISISSNLFSWGSSFLSWIYFFSCLYHVSARQVGAVPFNFPFGLGSVVAQRQKSPQKWGLLSSCLALLVSLGLQLFACLSWLATLVFGELFFFFFFFFFLFFFLLVTASMTVFISWIRHPSRVLWLRFFQTRGSFFIFLLGYFCHFCIFCSPYCLWVGDILSMF